MSPTAAILVIGNEILSGATQDANTSYIATHMSRRGIRVMEARTVPDIPAEIIGAVNALREKYTYVFTTGGIGPTHDDITADCVAEAFGVSIDVRDDARKILEDYYQTQGIVPNAARLRMARIPDTAVLIDNPISAAPGFKLGNVFVMAGIPKIMQSMLLHVDTMIEGGAPVLAKTVACSLKEGDIAEALGDVQKAFPDIDIGSYPRGQQSPSLFLILRGTDDIQLTEATKRVAALVKTFGEEPTIL